jgi:transcriptional regulator with XRE-family HTH domain
MLPGMPRAPLPDLQLAAAIRRLRLERGLTVESLAHDVGVTTGSLSRIELGRSAPAWATVRKIADALGVSLCELAAAIEAER